MMRYKQTLGEKIFSVFNIVFFILVSASMLYPLLNLLAISLSGPGPVLTQSVTLIPKEFTLDTYYQLFTANKIMRTMTNTIFITVVGTALSMIFTILTAYPLSRKYISARSALLKFIIFTMLFNGGMIPNYILVRYLGLIDSLWSLILPGMISAWNMILMVNFFKAIPDELEESARIDGANDLVILARIILPVSMSSIATIGLFYAVTKWNTFFNAVMYINDMAKYPLQVMLRQIISVDEAIGASDDILSMPPESKKAAAIFFSVIPILCVYPFLQKYFVKGIMVGSIKG